MTRPTGRPDTTTTTRRRRNDRGLTTLEWLLIVAAVAGLAALAVVLVQNVVDETAEQISGSSARLTAAQVAAASITDDNSKLDSESEAACRRLTITYSDAFTEEPGRTSLWTDNQPSTDRGGGVCGIVTNAVATAMRGGLTQANCAGDKIGSSAVPAADRGGLTVSFDAAYLPADCAFDGN